MPFEIHQLFAIKLEFEDRRIHCLVELTAEQYEKWEECAEFPKHVNNDQIFHSCGHNHRSLDSPTAERCWRSFVKKNVESQL
jgi:hypothetical protein